MLLSALIAGAHLRRRHWTAEDYDYMSKARTIRLHLCVLGVLLLLLLTHSAYGQARVDIGGRSLEMVRMDQSGPPVVFEAAITNGISTWKGILPAVSKFTTRPCRTRSDVAFQVDPCSIPQAQCGIRGS